MSKSQRLKKSQNLKIKKKNLRPSLKKRLVIPKINHELYLERCGFKAILGVDEVGRGSWAGPLVACAAKLPKNKKLYGLRDSKLLFFYEREKLYRKLIAECKYGIGVVEVPEINQMNLHQANLLAFKRAIENIKIKIDIILIDGFRVSDLGYPHKAIAGGDRVCSSIAAASIIAKVYRDHLMKKLARTYNKWGFEKHMGYGTKLHQEMLRKYGISKIHRLNYAPIKLLQRLNFD